MSDPAELPVEQRLVKGAGVMAALWRRGDRCTASWSITGACGCPKRSVFCKAREQWLALMEEFDGLRLLDAGVDHPFAIFDFMTYDEFLATGVTITADNGVKVGQKGNVSSQLARDIATGAAHGAESLVRLLKIFPHSRITGIEGAPA